jgi:hypothetical protein
MINELNGIMDWETGKLNDHDTLELFSLLIKNGHAWTLQGCYGRTAHNLIVAGYLSRTGEILKEI